MLSVTTEGCPRQVVVVRALPIVSNETAAMSHCVLGPLICVSLEDNVIVSYSLLLESVRKTLTQLLNCMHGARFWRIVWLRGSDLSSFLDLGAGRGVEPHEVAPWR